MQHADRQTPGNLPRQRAARTAGVAKSARRLLASLAAGSALSEEVADADALIAADLAVRKGDGTLAITQAGRAHLARLELARNGTIDPFLGQHLDVVQDVVETREGRIGANVDATESPLAWLARRKGRDGRALIEPAQLQAGERLRADFTRAQMMPRTTSNWTSAVAQDRRGAASVATYTDAVVAARGEVRSALGAAGPEFAGLLIDVCCFLKGLEDLERERGWPPRSAKVVLQLGLDRLARHYGYGAVARGKAHAAVRTWLADDTAFVVE
jgi:hypothetical protein